LLDPTASGLGCLGRHLVDYDIASGESGHLGDPGAHLAATDHTNTFHRCSFCRFSGSQRVAHAVPAFKVHSVPRGGQRRAFGYLADVIEMEGDGTWLSTAPPAPTGRATSSPVPARSASTPAPPVPSK